MDVDGVEASLCFPTIPRFCGQTFAEAKDKDLALACVHRLQRLDGRGVVRRLRRPPDPAADRSAVGRRRRRRRGPPQRRPRRAPPWRSARSRPSSACRRCTPATGSRSSRRAPRPTPSCACTSARRSQMPATSPDAPPAVAATLSFGNAMSSLSDYLFSASSSATPSCKLAYSEGQIGWIPYILERADDVWHEHRAWGGVRDIVPEPPSHVLAPPDLRLLLPRPPRPREPAPHRRRQRHVRDRLPAHRLDVAAHAEDLRRAGRRSRRRDRLQDRPRQRDPDAAARSSHRSVAQGLTIGLSGRRRWSWPRRVRNWGRWGPDDELGTLNLIDDAAATARRRLRQQRQGDQPGAAAVARRAADRVHRWPDQPSSCTRSRFPLTAEPDEDRLWHDDRLEMGTQACTHWDGLAHASYGGTHLQRLPRQ